MAIYLSSIGGFPYPDFEDFECWTSLNTNVCYFENLNTHMISQIQKCNINWGGNVWEYTSNENFAADYLQSQ